MKRKITAFALALFVLACSGMAIVPVSAAENSTWIELLETATVNDSGTNLFILNSASDFFSIKTPSYMRCTKVDVLISHAPGYSPKFLKVRYNGGYYTLRKAQLDDSTTRFYGDNIPDTLYADLIFEIAQNGTATGVSYQLLSCKVTALNSATYKASGYAELNGTQYVIPFNTELFDETAMDQNGAFQMPVVISDWQKFDRITISGSFGGMALNSVRATYSGIGIPYTMNYAVSNAAGIYSESIAWNDIKYYSYDGTYKGSTETESFTDIDYTGKVLYSVTLDLTGLDRTATGPIYCWFVGLANYHDGYSVQLIDVVGEVDIADTSATSWWKKFTSFMAGLFNPESSEADDLRDDASDQAGQLEDMNQQLEQVEKPPVDDIQMGVDGYVSQTDLTAVNNQFRAFTQHPLILTMTMLSLTIALVGYILYGKR